LAFDLSTITDGENATHVMGRPDFTTSTSGLSVSGLNTVRGLAYDSVYKRLFITDQANNRVVVYDVSTITNGESAVSVFGPNNFATGTAANTQAGLNTPRDIAYDAVNERLWTVESGNHRVKLYDATPAATVTSISSSTSNGTKVTGDTISIQVGFSKVVTVTGTPTLTLETGTTDAVVNYSSGSGTNTLTFNYTITSSHTAERLEVQSITALALSGGTINDALNIPATLTIPTATALGANEYFRVNPATSAISNGKTAMDVIGQYTTFDGFLSAYSGSSAHNGNTSAYALGFNLTTGSASMALDAVDHRLFVTDTLNHRVLVFNLDTNNTLIDRTPDIVLGQTDFVSTATTPISASSMNVPRAVVYESSTKRLFVVDTINNRVLVFDATTLTHGEAAVNVLGQSDFITNGGLTSQTRLNGPAGIALDTSTGYLYVSQTTNSHRITIYDVNAITDGEPAINILGKSSYVDTSS
jgi:fibronectin-binding autotransporter adhesin